MSIVTHKNIFFFFSAIVVALAISATAVFGLNLGIDFTGGTLTEFAYAAPTEKAIVEAALEPLSLAGYSLRAAGESGYILRTAPLSTAAQGALATALTQTHATIERSTAIGPTIGQELRHKALWAIALVALAIILFVAFAFRNVRTEQEVHAHKGVSSWSYGLIAIIALLHDILVPVGIFAVLGHYLGAQVDVLFVMALLAILGYSVNDTIVVFDRVRERLIENAEAHKKEAFAESVGTALSHTYARSVNTSLTTLIALLALYFLGSAVTQNFALVLIAGVVAGTYSSIFLAAPLLVALASRRQ